MRAVGDRTLRKTAAITTLVTHLPLAPHLPLATDCATDTSETVCQNNYVKIKLMSSLRLRA